MHRTAIVLALAASLAACATQPRWPLDPTLTYVPATATLGQLQAAGFAILDVSGDGTLILGPAGKCVPTVPPKMPPGMDLTQYAMMMLAGRPGGGPGALPPAAVPFEIVDHCYPYPG